MKSLPLLAYGVHIFTCQRQGPQKTRHHTIHYPGYCSTHHRWHSTYCSATHNSKHCYSCTSKDALAITNRNATPAVCGNTTSFWILLLFLHGSLLDMWHPDLYIVVQLSLLFSYQAGDYRLHSRASQNTKKKQQIDIRLSTTLLHQISISHILASQIQKAES
jgi:hypothetical protein